jgi:glycerol-3-phosphate acyltransferase PlsX
LANIGAEEIKGPPFIKNTYAQGTDINFIGNLDRKNCLRSAEVWFVTVYRQFISTTLEAVFLYFWITEKNFYDGIKNEISSRLLKKDLYALKKTMDPSTVGGVPLLGINGGVIKAHGSSDAEAFKNAIGQAIKFQQNNVVGKITNML